MNKTIYMIAIMTLLAGFASAAIPTIMNLQGRLTDSTTVAINGTNNFTLRIFDAYAGGNNLWTETQTNVNVSSGIFSIDMGSVTPINLTFNADYWVQIQVNSENLTPRRRISSVAYAFRANISENLTCVSCVKSAYIESVDASKVNAGTFGTGNFTFPNNLTVQGIINVSSAVFNSTFYNDVRILGTLYGASPLRIGGSLNVTGDFNVTGGRVSFPSDYLTTFNAGVNGINMNFTGSTNFATAGGLVGIGTVSPNATLQVNGSFSIINGTSGAFLMYVNSTSGRVGIGTASPSANRLQISGTGGALLLINGSTNSGWIRFNNDTTILGYLGYAQDGGLFTGQTPNSIGLRAENALHLGANGNSLIMTLNNSNVGIGTTNPGEVLHVFSSGGTRIKAAGTNANYMFLESDAAADNKLWDFQVNGEQLVGRVVNDAESAAANWLVVDRTGATVDNVVFPNGNVGIGTTDPTSNIGWSRSLKVEGSVNAGITVRDTDAALEGAFGTDSSGLFIDVAGHATASNNNVIKFRTEETNSQFTPTERMRIDSTGNVGIGTVAPGTLLDLQASAGDPFRITYYGTSGQPEFIGKMARGTSGSPTASQVDDSLAMISGMGYGATGFSTRRGFINIAAAENWTDAAQGTYISFATTAVGGTTRTEKVRIDGNGNVGIGTAIPNNKLAVVDTAQSATNNPGNAGLKVYATAVDATNPKFLNVGYDATLDKGYLQPIRSGSGGAFTDLLINPNGGNVGIGTTAPLGQTHIFVGTQTALKTYTASATTGRGLIFNYYQDSSSPNRHFADIVALGDQDGTLGGSEIRFVNNPKNSFTAVERMRISENGNVGIGTTAPQKNLHVVGASGSLGTLSGLGVADIAIFENNSTAANIAIISNTSGVARVEFGDSAQRAMGYFEYDNVNDSLRTYVNQAEKMRIDSSGNVGIGTTGPTAKLEVYSPATGNPVLNITEGNSYWIFDTGINGTGSDPGLLIGSTSNVYSNIFFAPFGASQMLLRGSAYGLALHDVSGNPIQRASLSLGFSADTALPTGLYVNGSIGIGTKSPSSLGLEIEKASANVGIYLDRTTDVTATGQIWVDANGDLNLAATTNDGVSIATNNDNRIVIDNTGNVLMDNLQTTGEDVAACFIASTGELIEDAATTCTSSSIRYKSNIRPIEYGLDDVLKLKPVSFTHNRERGREAMGLIAEDVEKIIPELVVYQDGQVETLEYYDFTGLFVKAIQEQQKEIEELKARLQTMEQSKNK